jgi:hypothetical protein
VLIGCVASTDNTGSYIWTPSKVLDGKGNFYIFVCDVEHDAYSDDPACGETLDGRCK